KNVFSKLLRHFLTVFCRKITFNEIYRIHHLVSNLINGVGVGVYNILLNCDVVEAVCSVFFACIGEHKVEYWYKTILIFFFLDKLTVNKLLNYILGIDFFNISNLSIDSLCIAVSGFDYISVSVFLE